MRKQLQQIVKNVLSIRPFAYKTYKHETGYGFFKTFFNKGNFGEYDTYRRLTTLPGYHQVVFNLYIPTGYGATTEIDCVYIHETGLYVIESKNYSGWIFGNETDNSWLQTFANGQQFPFYNPVKQNIGHIRALQRLFPTIPSNCYISVIVFSEHCTLKKVSYSQQQTCIVNRQHVKQTMLTQIQQAPTIFNKQQINTIYHFLSRYTSVDADVKEQHIKHIQQINK